MKIFSVRKAMPDDAYGINYVNAHTRYTTYKWLMPDDFLEMRVNSIDERTKKTRKLIEDGWKYLVVENTQTKEIVWMMIYWPSRNQDYPSSWEINAIYILPECQKLWLGKRLFLAWIDELIKLWYKDMIINILKWNNAINFYKKYGWKVVWERFDNIGRITIHENIMYFDNIESIK